MLVPREFNKDEFKKNLKNFSIVTEKIRNEWGLERVLNSNQPTISMWIDLIYEEYDLGSYSKEIIKPFDGILFFDPKLNRLIVFIFEKKFIYDEISRHIKNGFSKLFRSKEKDIFNIPKQNINMGLSKAIVFCEEIEGMEYFEYIKDVQESYLIDVCKINKINKELSFLDKMDIDFKREKYFNSFDGYPFYDAIKFFEKYSLSKKLEHIYNLCIECLKMSIPGEMKIIIKIDLLQITKYFKILAELGINNIIINNRTLAFYLDINEDEGGYYNTEDNDIKYYSWLRGDVNEQSIIDLNNLFDKFIKYIPGNELPNMKNFFYFAIEIKPNSLNYLRSTDSLENPVELKLFFTDKSIILKYYDLEFFIEDNFNYENIERIIDYKIIPLIRDKKKYDIEVEKNNLEIKKNNKEINKHDFNDDLPL